MSELTMRRLLQGLQQAVAEADQTVRQSQTPAGDCVGIQPQMAIDKVSFTVSFVADQVAPSASSAPSDSSDSSEADVRIAVDQQALADAKHVNTVSFTVRSQPVERLEVNGRHHIVPAGPVGGER
ncbi:hypothetical protein ACH4KN_06640 [Streptomyces sp. NPDC017546]|uniref:hypothetical protein n=1 Tax=unclassified Streptomyces TaxID=2593676 RepID=UPI00235ED34C|nr:hypothetical protein [Streptomyces sp. MMBL 11-1]